MQTRKLALITLTNNFQSDVLVSVNHHLSLMRILELNGFSHTPIFYRDLHSQLQMEGAVLPLPYQHGD